MKLNIVILTGAGFPMMWNSPSSSDIKKMISDIIKKQTNITKSILSDLTKKDISFELVLAAMETLLYNKLRPNYLSLFQKSRKNNYDENIIWHLYKECINSIIDKVKEYEEKALDCSNTKSKLFKDFYSYLSKCSSKINYYTLNYDEIVPQIICPNIDRSINYDIEKHLSLRKTFSNLHGSIYLKIATKGLGYEVIHNEFPQDLSNALFSNGGNPNEQLIFSPIITGVNKTQRILGDYFSHNVITFGIDLSLCDVLFIVGYSFSDPHINMLIKQYVVKRNKRIVLIDYNNPYYYTGKPNNIDKIITPQYQYDQDTKEEDWFYLNGRELNVYKLGFESFIKNPQNWKTIIESVN